MTEGHSWAITGSIIRPVRLAFNAFPSRLVEGLGWSGWGTYSSSTGGCFSMHVWPAELRPNRLIGASCKTFEAL